MRKLSKKLKDYQVKDEPHQNVRVTEISLSLDNMITLIFKAIIACIILGILISVVVFIVSGVLGLTLF